MTDAVEVVPRPAVPDPVSSEAAPAASPVLAEPAAPALVHQAVPARGEPATPAVGDQAAPAREAAPPTLATAEVPAGAPAGRPRGRVRSRLPVVALPKLHRHRARPRWWQELVFVLAVYWLYSLVRDVVPGHRIAAFHRASQIMSLERTLHVNVERSLNAFVAAQSWLANVSDYYYATLHLAVTVGVLVWLYRRHPLQYRPLRTALMATNVVALVGFWTFALAPPRMLTSAGFVDTVVHFHTWGSWGSSGVDSASNQFAAMPSLHVAWSLWCAIALIRFARQRWVKVLAAAYPLATTFVILGTANHYVFDVLGGVVVLVVGFVVQRLLYRAFLRPRPVLSASD